MFVLIKFKLNVNDIFNLISKLSVHKAKILQNRCYLILNVYAKVLKASVHDKNDYKRCFRHAVINFQG